MLANPTKKPQIFINIRDISAALACAGKSHAIVLIRNTYARTHIHTARTVITFNNGTVRNHVNLFEKALYA